MNDYARENSIKKAEFNNSAFLSKLTAVKGPTTTIVLET